jgi:DNA-binding Xre family transcriptional regulator
MKRQVSYQWRLRAVMAEHNMFNTTELVPLLAERGIVLSASQVHRLVSGVPERLSLPVLAALCDIFDTTPAQLVVTSAQNLEPRRLATAGDSNTIAGDPEAVRPLRATLRPAP